MFKLIRRLVLRWRRLRDELRYDRYQGLNIGSGCQYTLENLDGIAPQLIKIGEDCILAPQSVVLTHDASLVPTTGKYLFKPVEIGNRVFIGYGAVIMPGIHIGDDVVVGSNSVVTKDIPTGVVVAGVPAKILCETTELARRRSDDLQNAVFDWRIPVTHQVILQQQAELQKQFGKKS